MFTSKSELKAKLQIVCDELSSHPMASADFREAQKIIDSRGKSDLGGTSDELMQKGLPTIEEVGAITLRNLRSWVTLNRQRKRLERKLGGFK